MNISTGTKTSVNELVTLLEELLGSPLDVRREAPREGDILHSYLDHAKATEVLGWKPEYSLREGLEKTLRFYRT